MYRSLLGAILGRRNYACLSVHLSESWLLKVKTDFHAKINAAPRAHCTMVLADEKLIEVDLTWWGRRRDRVGLGLGRTLQAVIIY
jgi:hypothetical protein